MYARAHLGARLGQPVYIRGVRLGQAGAVVGGGASLVAGAATGGIATAITGAASLVTGIIGIFTQHAIKSAMEQDVVMGAAAGFSDAAQQVYNAANAGTITQAQAKTGINQCLTQYYQACAGIPMKKSGNCSTPGWPGPSPSPGTTAAQCVWPVPNGGGIKLSQCNAACNVGCLSIEPAACALTVGLQNPGTPIGPLSIDFNESLGVTIPQLVYLPPVASTVSASSLVTSLTSATGLSSWLIYGGLALAAYMLFKK